jgi:hypothetical protein
MDQQEEIYDLCFVSTFCNVQENANESWWHDVTFGYHKITRLLFEVVFQFANLNNLKMCVALKCVENSEKIKIELDYYKTVTSNVEMIPRSGFSSYGAVQVSKLSITLGSTLGYEALGFGRRVMIGHDIDEISSAIGTERWDNNLMTFKLGELQRIRSLDYNEFSTKALKLLHMTDEEYVAYSNEAREYYMNINPTNFPHKIIKNKIEQFLA